MCGTPDYIAPEIITMQARAVFEAAVEKSLVNQQFDAQADVITAMYAKICAAIRCGIDTLPDNLQGKGIRREVSAATQDLFDERQRLRDTARRHSLTRSKAKSKRTA